MRGLRRLAATLGVVAMGAACGPGAASTAARPAGVRCDPDDLAPCERKIAAAVRAGAVPRDLVVAYVGARRAHHDEDAWARLWQELGAHAATPAALVVVMEEVRRDEALQRELSRASLLVDTVLADLSPQPAAAAGKPRTAPPQGFRSISTGRLERPQAIEVPDLLLAFAEASGTRHLVHLRGGRAIEVTHVFPSDPLAPFVPAVVPALREASVTSLADDLALAIGVRGAFEHAARGAYDSAAALADMLLSRTTGHATRPDAAGAPDALRPSAVRVRFALEVLAGAGLLLEPESGEPLEAALPHPAPAPRGTAYEDWLRVRTARDERGEWARRRERVLADAPADRRADLDALHPRPGDCSTQARPPPPIAGPHDLVFATRIASALAPRAAPAKGAPGAPEPSGQLPLAEWLPRYEALVKTVERTRTAWAHLPSLLSQRGEVMGLEPAGSALYRRVSELALAHVAALRALERGHPVRYRALSHLPLVFSPGVLGDERVRAAVVELTQATVQDKLAAARDAAAVFDALLAGAFAGMSYPPAIQSAHFVALQGAFTAKLRGDLTRQRGWPVAGLYGLDAIVRMLSDREQATRTLSHSAEEVARALAGPDVAHPAAAALATSAARYLALALDGKLDAGRADPTTFAPERRAARAALMSAVRSMAGPGEKPPDALVDDITTLADGLTAAVASHLLERSKPPAAAAPRCPKDQGLGPVVLRAVARLGDVRRRIFLHPRFERAEGAWGRRSRLLVTLLSDALDVLAARSSPHPGGRAAGRQLGVPASAAEARLRDGLADWEQRAGAVALSQVYLLLREVFVAESSADLVAKSGGRIRGALEAARLFFQGEGKGGGARIALLETLSRLPATEAPRAGEELLVAYARAFFERGQRDQGELLLVASLGVSALTRSAPSKEAVDLAAANGSRVAWALRFLAEVGRGRRGAPLSTEPFATGIRAVRDDACGVASADDVLTAMNAVHGFASGRRAEARAALDALLDKAERQGLSVPKITYRYEEKTETKVLALSLDVSYGAGFLEGASTVQLGLGIRSRGEPEGSMTTAFAPVASAEAGEEAARTYVHLAALAAVYHYLDKDPARGAVAAGRAVAAVTGGVRLGPRAVSSTASPAWAIDARPLLAVDAQLAAEAGQPFLAGDLWTVLRASLPPDTDDAGVTEAMAEAPLGLAAVADAKPVLDRARRSLRIVAAPLPCTDAKVETGGFEEAACDGYPLAVSLRIADALKRLPRLRRGAEANRCADLRALDAFLEPLDRRTYDPDAFTRAVQALAAEGKVYDAAVLLARHRNDAHCSPTLGGAARSLVTQVAPGAGAGASGAALALPAALRADLLSVAVNCFATHVDDRLVADLLLLDETTRAMADAARNFKVLLFTADLALRGRRWDVLAKMAAQPEFVARWLDGNPAAGTASLLVDHAAAALNGRAVDAERTRSAFELFCKTFPPGDRAELCADVEALRAGGPTAAARAEAALSRLLASATSPPKPKRP